MTRNPKLRRASDTKDELIDEIVRASARRAHPFDARRDIVGFLREYYRNVAVEDLRQSSPGELAAAALCHAALGASRKPGQHKIRVYNPSSERDGWQSTHTIIEIVNDDMPFLVDSTAMAIDRCGLGLHLTVHPLIRVTRTRAGKLKRFHPAATAEARVESFIRCEIDRVSHRATVGKLNDEIENTLSDVRAAVRDWAEMREQMRDCARQIDAYDLALDPTLSAESAHLLEWMADNHFTYLGYQEYSLDRNGQKLTLRPVNGTGLGLLSETRHDASEVQLTQAMRRHALSKEILIITKANSRSTIHRPTYLDYIGVKLFDESGTPVGERRFLGLFTSLAYSESPRNIPLLRLKVHRIVERSGLDPASHRGKALAHILDTYPRDELLQASVQDLARTSAAILNLQDRRQVRLFIRRDAFRRFFSCLVYVPRDKYNTRVRLRIEQILMDAFGGTGVDSAVEISDAVLARLHTIVHTAPGDKPKVSILKIESAIRGAVVTWQDRLRDALVERFGEEDGLDWFERYGAAFPLAYEEDNEPAAAADDVGRLHRAISGVAAPSETMFLFRTRDTAGHRALHFKLIRERSLPLSDALPVLENLGLRVISERPYGLTFPDGRRRWIQDFEVSSDTVASGDLGSLNESFAECFCGVLDGVIENDSFNQLIVRAGLTVREVVLVRTYAKYLLQLGLPFSQGYMERVLARHPRFARRFVETFAACFDPGQGTRGRRRREEKAERRLARATEKAATLDEDRILSAFAGALGATVRSNYYQRDDEGGVRAVLALKLTPGELDEAPQPRPRFEIFIYSPRVEGVHLRAGAIARGGIRWSDRKEDFRTEILGLMKAQTVKNTVIVPTGAKGGFVAKHLPRGDREAIGREVVACYEAFIGGLLDVTDNLDGDNVVPPPATVRRDDDDPYLVVAADKGTAAFSDIANGISEARGFWLGDAFASGGSAGYDHKKMGITARGAWEAVMRHFRELGVNTQRDEFTVIGIGDMGGDVFGNGMLLSRTIRLLAAFNHLHIFIDPDPNAAASFKERQRLFRLRRSTWEDYDKSLISKGGGVFSRAAKSIPLSREIRALLGTDAKSLSPLALINAILKAPADLLWNGGIGTYVKADAESHAEAGDRANDGLRVDATELNVRVVGEGGNLGLTQKGRIQFALAGGKINTDFIDNSAGVDSSDREVNIKILLGLVALRKRLPRKRRDKLLAEMTDDVAGLVLRNNYLQTQSISMIERHAAERLQEYITLIRSLEHAGLLHRTLEGLPNEEELDQRRQQQQGLTRPELAVLLSYAKIDLYDSLAGRSLVRQNYHLQELGNYFPPPLPQRYQELLKEHRLSAEILATMITNSIVNRMGPAFVSRIRHDTGATAAEVARAYAIARDVSGARGIWADVEQLDNAIDAGNQYEMLFEVSRRLRHACYWLIRYKGSELKMDASIAHFGPPLAKLYKWLPNLVSGGTAAALSKSEQTYLTLGAPPSLAKRLAALGLTTTLFDIVEIAGSRDQALRRAAELYFELGARLGLDWLELRIDALKARSQWQALARSTLRDSVHEAQKALSQALTKRGNCGPAAEIVGEWTATADSGAADYQAFLADVRRTGQSDYATLSVIVDRLRQLVAGNT